MSEHPFIKTPTGFRLTFKNGWAVSVQWGDGNYCTNKDNPQAYGREFLNSNTAEVLIFDNRGEPYGDCVGWRNAGQVAAILIETAAR